MDIKELQYFKAVCEQKSITQAAYSLYMTPQGLSKVMKNMEADWSNSFDLFWCRSDLDRIGEVSLSAPDRLGGVLSGNLQRDQMH